MSFSLFSTPQQPQQQSLFGSQQQQSLFGNQSQPFQSTTSLWSQPQQQQQQLQPQQPQPQQPQRYLFTNDKAPASYSTKWADLTPESQKVLLQIEERILEGRAESQRLDQCSRLYDSSVSSNGFEHDASHILQELGGINSAMERQKALLQELMSSVKGMLRNTEVAIRSYMMLRPRFVHQSGSGTSIATTPSQAPGATKAPGSTNQPSSSIVPIFDFYSGVPKKPSPYLQQTVARFEKYIGECRQWVEEIEQLIRLDSNGSSCLNSSLAESLPKVMMNVHDFFVHVAAKVESIHQYIESMKTAYLVDQRHRGEGNNPFLEADRRETARQEAAAKRVHPTLHLPQSSQPSTQVAGLFTSSSTPVPQTSGAVTSATSGSSFSLLGTPSSAPSMPLTSLFSTPSASAPNSSLFGPSSSASPQAPLFGTSTPSFPSTPAFGSTPAAAGGSLFSTPAAAGGSLFSTPAAAGGSLFSTPFASGAAVGSGASFGPGGNKSSRPKSRTARR